MAHFTPVVFLEGQIKRYGDKKKEETANRELKTIIRAKKQEKEKERERERRQRKTDATTKTGKERDRDNDREKNREARK